MQLTYSCPNCSTTNRCDCATEKNHACAQCGWDFPVDAGKIVDGNPSCCLACGNDDLWRQKDFPQSLGILAVFLGAVLSSIAWYYYQPLIAIGILMGFAALDMILYLVMPDVLVCYRCHARHRVSAPGEQFAGYNHELGEKYRQDRIRQEQADAANPSGLT
ncbi:MAG: hypothetical protein R3C01_08975 [Planctomycetaceae bacterium]